MLAAIGLGIAGIDPVGALVAVGALSNGARGRDVVAYGLVTIIVTTALGVVLSLLVGARIADIDWSFLDAGYQFWATGELIAGVGLLVWGGMRLRRPAASDTPPRERGTGAAALVSLGVVFGLGAVLDPTFVSLVVLAGRDGSLVGATLAHLLWILTSQAPMVVVIAAVLSGKHRTVVRQFQAWWSRVRPAMARVGTALALLAGLVLVIDAGWWFATDEFLIQF